MYQVYSIQRPGRPKWALTASGLLLILSIGVAWALIQTKARGTYVRLDTQSKDYPAGGLRVRLPAGWETLDAKTLARFPAVVIGARAGDGLDDETVFVFRAGRRPFGLPSADAVDILHETFGPTGQASSQPAMIGPFFARSITTTIPSRPGQPAESHLLARIAIAPDGQTFGILLLLPRKPTPHHVTLLDEMSGSLQLLDATVGVSPAALMADAGIRFEPPPKTKFVSLPPPPGPPPPRLRLISDDKAACWYLHVWRTPLLGTRTCEQLVESLALTTLHEGRLDEKPTKRTIAGREVVQATISPYENAEPGCGVQIWCARIDERNAVLLAGQHEPEAASTLNGVCESILAGVSLMGTEHAIDIPAALKTGQECLREIAKEKLASKWGDLVGHDQRFTFNGPGGIEFRMENSYEAAARANGFRRWRLTTTFAPPEPLPSTTATVKDEWILRDDTAEHDGRMDRMGRFHPEDQVVYRESRSAGTAEVICRLTMPQKETQEWKLAIDDSYACEPILLEATARVARDREKHTAVFSTSEEFNPHLSWVVATPLGELPLPGSKGSRSAAAVRVWSDYDGEPTTLYFDDSDHLICMTFEAGRRQDREVRSSRQDNPRSPLDRRR